MNIDKNKLLKRSTLLDIIFSALMAEIGSKKVEQIVEYALTGLNPEQPVVTALSELMELTHEQLAILSEGEHERGGHGMRLIGNVITAHREGDKLTSMDAVDEHDMLLTALAFRVPQHVIREVFDDIEQHVSVKAGVAVQELFQELREKKVSKLEMLRLFKVGLDPSLQGPTSIEQQASRRSGGARGSSIVSVLMSLLGAGGASLGGRGVRVMSLDDLFGDGPGIDFDDLLSSAEGRKSAASEPDGSITVGDLWREENQTFGLITSVEDFLRRNRPRTDAVDMDGVRKLPLRLFKDMKDLDARYREVFGYDGELAEMLVVIVNLIHADLVQRYKTVDEAIATVLAKHPERAEGELKAAERQKVVDAAVAKGEPTPDCGCKACNAKRRARGEAPVIERSTQL